MHCRLGSPRHTGKHRIEAFCYGNVLQAAINVACLPAATVGIDGHCTGQHDGTHEHLHCPGTFDLTIVDGFFTRGLAP